MTESVQKTPIDLEALGLLGTQSSAEEIAAAASELEETDDFLEKMVSNIEAIYKIQQDTMDTFQKAMMKISVLENRIDLMGKNVAYLLEKDPEMGVKIRAALSRVTSKEISEKILEAEVSNATKVL